MRLWHVAAAFLTPSILGLAIGAFAQQTATEEVVRFHHVRKPRLPQATTSARVAMSDIKVNVNGAMVVFPDQEPKMFGDRVLVPMRGVFEKLNARVDWVPDQQMVRAVKDGQNVLLFIGKPTASIGERPVPLDQPATLVNGRAMVPLRFLGEALGARVDWHSAELTVDISTGGG